MVTVAWELYLGDGSSVTQLSLRLQLQGIDVAIVYSNLIRDRIVDMVGAPESQFRLVSYESNQSRAKLLDLRIDGYVYSGGNS